MQKQGLQFSSLFSKSEVIDPSLPFMYAVARSKRCHFIEWITAWQNKHYNQWHCSLEHRYNVLLTCSCEHRMMIHEYHKIVGKTKTRQELTLKNKNRVRRFVYFYLTVDSLKKLKIRYVFIVITIFLFPLLCSPLICPLRQLWYNWKS